MKTVLGAMVFMGIAMLAAPASEVRAQALKLAVFDSQRVSEETALGRRVQADLGAIRDRKQAEIREKQQAIADLEKQLSQQALSLSPEKRLEMEKKIQLQLLDLQTAQEAARREMQLEFQSASDDFQKKLELVVSGFGKEEGFTLILDRSLAAFASDAVDVTTVIVDRFDKTYPVTAK